MNANSVGYSGDEVHYHHGTSERATRMPRFRDEGVAQLNRDPSLVLLYDPENPALEGPTLARMLNPCSRERHKELDRPRPLALPVPPTPTPPPPAPPPLKARKGKAAPKPKQPPAPDPGLQARIEQLEDED